MRKTPIEGQREIMSQVKDKTKDISTEDEKRRSRDKGAAVRFGLSRVFSGVCPSFGLRAVSSPPRQRSPGTVGLLCALFQPRRRATTIYVDTTVLGYWMEDDFSRKTDTVNFELGAFCY